MNYKHQRLSDISKQKEFPVGSYGFFMIIIKSSITVIAIQGKYDNFFWTIYNGGKIIWNTG